MAGLTFASITTTGVLLVSLIMNIAPYQLPHTVPPPALHVCSICILRPSLCLLYLQAIVSKGKFLHDLEIMTSTTHCSLPMTKRLSNKAISLMCHTELESRATIHLTLWPILWPTRQRMRPPTRLAGIASKRRGGVHTSRKLLASTG